MTYARKSLSWGTLKKLDLEIVLFIRDNHINFTVEKVGFFFPQVFTYLDLQNTNAFSGLSYYDSLLPLPYREKTVLFLQFWSVPEVEVFEGWVGNSEFIPTSVNLLIFIYLQEKQRCDSLSKCLLRLE